MKKAFALLITLISLNSIAATQGLSVSGTVSSLCSFGSTTNGIFGFDVATPFLLDTGVGGGTNASVGITYNSTPTISIGKVTAFTQVPSGFTDSVTFNNVFTSSNQGSISYSGNTASFTQTGGSTDTLTLRLGVIDNAGSFPIGTYGASTVVTCQ